MRNFKINNGQFRTLAARIGGLFHSILSETGLMAIKETVNFCKEAESRMREEVLSGAGSDNIKEMLLREAFHRVPFAISANSYGWITMSGNAMIVERTGSCSINIRVSDRSNLCRFIEELA